MRALALLGLLALAACGRAPSPGPLPRLTLAPGVTVSGVSSGGYMAVQYQVAFARQVTGAGVVAAGPWYCAQSLVTRALDDCTKGAPAGPGIRPLVAALRASAAAGFVDAPSWLEEDRVFVFHGERDAIVGAAVVDSLVRFYRELLPAENIRYETTVPAGHGFPTEGFGGPCEASEVPWLLDCGYDAAGEILKHLYGALAPPSDAPAGELLEFDQARYETGGRLASLDARGFVYVPEECARGLPCRLHVAFHGCGQGRGAIGDTFVRHAGYNRWADTNRLVVLYPQAEGSLGWPFNPRGCWDWWGYSGPEYASRYGKQLASVRRMVEALGAS